MSLKSVKVDRIEALIGAESLQSLVTVAIVGGALLRIAQHAIGFGRFLEFLFGVVIVGIAIRMVFHGQLSVGALQGRDRRNRGRRPGLRSNRA